MIRNGWRLSDGKAIWIAQTEPDPQGNSHTIMVVVGHEEFPDPRMGEAMAASRQRGEEVPIPEPGEGLFLKLMFDGQPRAMMQLGGAFDLPLEKFVELNRPEGLAESAIEMVIARKGQQAQQ